MKEVKWKWDKFIKRGRFPSWEVHDFLFSSQFYYDLYLAILLFYQLPTICYCSSTFCFRCLPIYDQSYLSICLFPCLLYSIGKILECLSFKGAVFIFRGWDLKGRHEYLLLNSNFMNFGEGLSRKSLHSLKILLSWFRVLEFEYENQKSHRLFYGFLFRSCYFSFQPLKG